ncbi:MAG: class II glutamine amidotransferase [Phycisphaerales bacterium]|nr:class II glutamine amidotransferase [Phycisphaerales bacterium]
MCRFILYKGPPLRLSSLITEPDHSLIHQSTRSRESEEPLNGDGFGVAWYNPDLSPEPATFRSVTPAWNNRNLLDLARVTQSSCVLAHVRAATSGQPVTELNCHPFTSGRYAFMHNGDIGGFSALRRRLLAGLSDSAFNAIQGSTDSEHLFALLLDRLARAGRLAPDAPPASGDDLAAALEGTIQDVLALARQAGAQEPSYLNIAVSDGRSAVACRFTSDAAEHASSLHLHTGRRYTCEDGVCRMIDPIGSTRAVLISSEPLSSDPGWTSIPANHAVVIDADQATRLLPIRAAA